MTRWESRFKTREKAKAKAKELRLTYARVLVTGPDADGLYSIHYDKRVPKKHGTPRPTRPERRKKVS